MIKIFLILLFLIISNNASSAIKGQALICDKDRRGYYFISNKKVEVLGINFVSLNITSISHLYELTDSTIFIKKLLKEFPEEKTKPIGWIFRRSLDYVSLDYVNGDWNRKFLWSCEITTSKKLEIRLRNKLYKSIKSS